MLDEAATLMGLLFKDVGSPTFFWIHGLVLGVSGLSFGFQVSWLRVHRFGSSLVQELAILTAIPTVPQDGLRSTPLWGALDSLYQAFTHSLLALEFSARYSPSPFLRAPDSHESCSEEVNLHLCFT